MELTNNEISLEDLKKEIRNKNSNLRKAAKEKNDEFYTLLEDIEKEVKHYRKQFKGKVVYCNCDDPEWSNFYKYFSINFDYLGLKKVVSTHYEQDGSSSYKLELLKQGEVVRTELKGNGDFRSEECIEILKESDVVVSNPPFSLFREYVSQLMEYDKKFLIVGNNNAITYKETFGFIKENKLWQGVNPRGMDFILPNGEKKNVNANWWTNMENEKRNGEIILVRQYKGNELEYPKYDNYNAIEISKVKDIPLDYDGYMGVPITFMDKYNPNQFKILGIMNTGEENKGIRYENTPHGRPVINGVEKYLRILIKKI